MEIVGRLFNHRPVVSGEVNLMINSFDKRLKKDEEILNAMSKSTTHLAFQTLPTSEKLVSDHLVQVQAKAFVCLQMCEKILETEEAETNEMQHSHTFRIQLEVMKIQSEKEKEKLNREFDLVVGNMTSENDQMQLEWDNK